MSKKSRWESMHVSSKKGKKIERARLETKIKMTAHCFEGAQHSKHESIVKNIVEEGFDISYQT